MFWGLAAITAAEYNLPNRPDGDTWLTLAERVFNDQKKSGNGGWETTICGGGLRWQKDVWQGGYTMKNSVSNGGFFMLAARLAWFKQEDEFATWAEKVWDWATKVKLVNKRTWEVADSVSAGSGGADGCTLPDHTRWTYNYGTFLSGAAYMYAYVSIKAGLLFSHADDKPCCRRTTANGSILPATSWIHCLRRLFYLNKEE